MPDADCRLAIGQACVLIRLQDAGPVFRPISLWLEALGPSRLTRHPRLGDSLPSYLRGCPDRYLVLRPLRRLGSHGPESFVCGLTGYPLRSTAGHGRGHSPAHPTGNSAHHPARNPGRDSPRYLGHYLPRCPPHHNRSLLPRRLRGPRAASRMNEAAGARERPCVACQAVPTC